MTDFKDTAMGYPTSLVPTGTWPLDSRSYFEDKLSADAAAAKAEEASRIGTSMYYIGQPITVYDKTDGSVKLYYIGEDKALHQIEDAEKAKQVADYLSNAISSKIFVSNFDKDGNTVSAYTDLSVIKIGKTSYELSAISDALLSNVLYVISCDYLDMYGQQLKNLAEPTELSDATNKFYVDDKFAKVKTALADALTVNIEETSNLSTAINAIVSLRNVLTALYT